LHGVRQSGGEELVDLDGRDTVPGLEQTEGERAQPGADLDDVRGVLEAGGGDDRAHGIGVDDEVLPLLLRRAQTDVSGYLAYVAGGQYRHSQQLTALIDGLNHRTHVPAAHGRTHPSVRIEWCHAARGTVHALGAPRSRSRPRRSLPRPRPCASVAGRHPRRGVGARDRRVQPSGLGELTEVPPLIHRDLRSAPRSGPPGGPKPQTPWPGGPPANDRVRPMDPQTLTELLDVTVLDRLD